MQPDGRAGVFFSAVGFSQHSAGEKAPGRPSWSHGGEPRKDLEEEADSPRGRVTTGRKHKGEKPAGRCLQRSSSPPPIDVAAETRWEASSPTQTPSPNASFSSNNNDH